MSVKIKQLMHGSRRLVVSQGCEVSNAAFQLAAAGCLYIKVHGVLCAFSLYLA